MSASVRLHGVPIGTLSRTRDGGLAFSYDERWLRNREAYPLSMSLPLRPERFSNAKAGPFFDGLLPDAKSVRRALYSHFQVETEYDLLFALGRDCPGAVTIVPCDAPVVSEEDVTPKFDVLAEADLAQHIRDLPRRPLFVDADGELRLSLAGVHSKAAVVMSGGQVALPKGQTPSTHILKVDIERLDDSIRVENFCLALARQLGIPTPKTTVAMAEDQVFLLIGRYDRRIVAKDGGRFVQRLHQEDFCQALGRFPHEKYEKNGGPGWVECFELLRQSQAPAADRTDLLRRCVFQFLINNPDAHAKNYSIVYKGQGFSLAPLYDVNNAAAYKAQYKRQLKRLAMSVAGERDPDRITGDHWRQFASEIGMKADFVLTTVQDMATRLAEIAPRQRQGVKGQLTDSPLLDLVVEDVVERCEMIRSAGQALVP